MNRRLAIPIVALYALLCGVAHAAQSISTETTLTANPTTATVGQSVTLTATVSAGTHPTPTGSVTFWSGATMLGAKTLSSGTAAFKTTLLPAGANSVKAFYLGDTTNVASPSGSVTVTVTSRAASNFTQPTGAGSVPDPTAPLVIAYGDFSNNNNGEVDLAVAQSGGGIAIFLGAGDGTFTTPTTKVVAPTLVATDVKVADFDGDGKADLAVLTGPSSISSAGQVVIIPGLGGGSFDTGHEHTVSVDLPAAPPYTIVEAWAAGGATGLAIADFNGDGIADLAVAQWQFYAVDGAPIIQNFGTVFLGNGDFTFGSAIQAAGVNDQLYAGQRSGAIAAGFFRSTGPDLVLADVGPGGKGVIYLQGDGASTPSFGSKTAVSPDPPVAQDSPYALGDFDNDSHLDIAWLDAGGNIMVALGNGSGGFGTPKSTATGQGSNVKGLAASDFNGDGKLDVVFTLPAANGVALATGKGDGTFTVATTPTNTGNYPVQLVAADFNGDGRTDFAASARDSNAVSVRLGVGPNFASLSPTSMVVGASHTGGNFTLTVNGSNFASGYAVTWTSTGSTSTTNLTTTCGSSTQCTATVPDSLVATLGTAKVAVTDPNTPGLTSNSLTFTIGSGPTITTLSPSSAPAGGSGFDLTITGTNLVTGDVVIWQPSGGTAQNLSTTTVTGTTSLTVAIPNTLILTADNVTVSVQDPNGPVTNTLPFLIAPPAITSLDPSGIAAGSSNFSLVINGTNLVSGDTVTWTPSGGTATSLTNTTANSGGTQLTVPITASMVAVQGTVAVGVTGATGTLTFTIGPGPQITSLSQTTAVAGSGQFTLTVYGTGFTSGDTVTWKSGALATTYVNAGQLTAVVDASLLTAVDSGVQIKVVETGGAASNAVTFTVVGPIIASLTPSSIGTASGNTTVVITGSNFVASGSTVNVTGPGGSQTGVPATASSSTSLTFTLPSAVVGKVIGTVQVQVVNPGGASSVQAPIAVNAPNIAGVNPPSGTTGGSTDLTISVTGANFSPTATVIWCAGCSGSAGTPLATTFTASTTLTAVIPMKELANPGSATIWVNNDSSSLSDQNINSTPVTFPIASLTVASISPKFALAGGPQFTMTITGANFATGASILWGALAPLQPVALSSSQISVIVPADHIATAGQYSVAVQNPNGSVSPAVIFTVGQLQVLSVAPSPIVAGTNGLVLTVSGQYFDGSTQIQWIAGTTTTLTSNFIDSHTITAMVPANLIAQAGTAQITAFESAQSVTSPPVQVIVNGPAIASINPTSSGVSVPTFSIQISGLNFLSGSTVQWNSGLGQAQPLPTTFVNATSLLAIVPSSLVASAGTALVTVQNPGNGGTGAVSNGVAFTVGPAPTIKTDGSGLAPSGTTAGGPAFSLTVTGTNFQTGAIAVWTANGSATNLTTAFGDSSHLTATVPASLIATAGSATISVQNPGGIVSNAVMFTVGPSVIPTISTLTPSSKVAGDATFQLGISGNNFANGAVAYWNAGSTPQALATIFVNSTELSAVVPSSLITAVGTAFITVTNPGSTASAALAFQITATAPPSQPTITSLSQTNATAGSSSITLGVTGTNFVSGSVVQWNAGTGPQALATNYLSSGQLVALLPAGLLTSGGVAFLNVLNPNSAASNSEQFTIQAQPAITANGLTPASANAGGPAFQLLVSGSNFVSGAAVEWNTGSGPVALVTSFLSTNQLLAIVPDTDIAVQGTVFVSVQNPGGATSNVVTFPINAALPSAPTIASGGLNPPSATAGGTAFMLIVTGTNYTSASVVQWNSGSGGQQQLSTTYVNSTQLTALVPANLVASSGVAFVSVQTPGGGTSNLVAFTINPQAGPTINTTGGLSPAQVTAGSGGFQIGVSGTNFMTGSTVQWNAGTGAQSLATVYLSGNQLTALVPASLVNAAGTAFLDVQNPGGSISNLVTFTINATPSPAQPTIAVPGGLSPDSATMGGSGFLLSVTGTNFVSGTVVQWSTGGAAQSLSTSFNSATQVTAVVPANLIGSAGTAFITVQNPGGSGSNLATFTIDPQTIPPSPTITSPGGLSPASAIVGGAQFQLTVSGTNFVTGSQVQWNGGSGPQTLQTAYVSSTQLMAIVPASLIAGTGTAFVSVLNPGNLPSNSASFAINPAVTPPNPSITNPGGLSPSGATAGGAAFQLAVTGAYFQSGAVVQWISAGATQALQTTFAGSTQLTAAVPASLIATPGTVFVSVQNPGGATSNLVTFPISSVAGPAIATSGGVSPAAVATGTNGVTLTISGANFVNGSVVQWNAGAGPQALQTGYSSTTQLTALVPAGLLAAPASVLISVLNPDKSESNAVLFQVTGAAVVTPTLSSMAPVSIAAGSAAFQLVLTGQNFVGGSSTSNGSVVQWNGSALPTTVNSSSQLSALVDPSLVQSTGSNFVNVVNPGGAVSSGLNFLVVGPALTTLAPASVTAGAGAFTLSLTGSNFVSGSAAVWNGTTLATTVSSATLLTALVPANLVANAGTAFVLATNPGGASTMPQVFNISAPNAASISGLTPSSAVAGGPAFQLTITGSGFGSGSVVWWNGAALATGYLSSTQLTALVDSSQIAAAGSANVAVQVPGATMSSSLKFTINGPQLTTLSPATVNAGDPAFSLTVTGSNFVPGSAVLWNANLLPTAYIGPTQIMASVPESYVKSPGTVSITVQNPGGAISPALNFSVGSPSLHITTASLADGVVGTFYSRIMSVSGGDLPYTWSISAGALPDGLSLDAGSGTLSGTPTGAASIALGVTVTDSKGRTATASLQLRVATSLTITTASPLPAAMAGNAYSQVLQATGGTAPYLWSSTGTLPDGLLLNVSSGEISGTPSAPGGYHFTITATDSRQQQTTSKSYNLIVSIPSFTIGGFTGSPATASPAQQVPLTVSVGTPFMVDLNGALTLNFASAAGGDDPSIQFSTGGRTVSFTIPAGTTQAVFGGNSQLSVSTGTVAGTITIQGSLKAGASDITPSPIPQVSATVSKLPPVITSVAFKQVTGGVSVAISGYSTTKEVTQATIQFNASSGSVLNAPAATVSLAATLSAWYQSAAAAPFGSQFTVTLPFNVQGDIKAVGSATVTLTNTQGNSSPVTAALQ